MKIRQIQPKDDPQLATIIRHLLKSFGLDKPGTAYFDPELDHLSDYYAQSKKREYFVLVDDNDRVLGGNGIAEYDRQNGVAELQKLYISESAQGNHMSFKLIDAALEFAKQAGYREVYLETHHDLAAAVHLYQRYGFRKLDGPLGGGEHSEMDIFFAYPLV